MRPARTRSTSTTRTRPSCTPVRLPSHRRWQWGRSSRPTDVTSSPRWRSGTRFRSGWPKRPSPALNGSARSGGSPPWADPGRGRSDGGPATARHRDHPSRRCRLQRSRPERPQDRELASNFTDQAPEDIVDAQFSLPYLLALELAERSPARGLSESDLTDLTVLDVAARVTVHHEAEMDAPFHSGHMPSRVVVHRRTGGVVEAAVSDPVWGGPGGSPSPTTI